MIKYFKRPVHQIVVTKPEEIKGIGQFDVICNVKGGGLSGQAVQSHTCLEHY